MLNIQFIWKLLEDRKQVFPHSLFHGVFARAIWSHVACEKISQNNVEPLCTPQLSKSSLSSAMANENIKPESDNLVLDSYYVLT